MDRIFSALYFYLSTRLRTEALGLVGNVLMRDQVTAGGAGMAARQERGAARSRAPQADVGVPAQESAGSIVISPDLDQWRLAQLRRNGAPVGGALKRAFDVTAASAAIVVLSPLLAGIWAAIAIERAGKEDPVFRQERGGFGGAPFAIYKFRTMFCAESGATVKQVQSGDERITPLGRFLRRASWDELPQLFNVLKGEMSLIGPRPHATGHDRDFAAIDPTYPQRFAARPGITGLAQVSGCRGPTETDDKVIARTQFDVEYTRNWSFFGDVQIALRTLMLFVKRDPGAM
jgi:putative colanic acid biosynthesis UDP-glucose lipid carrier transferase